MNKRMTKTEYGADQIQVLEGLEAVRKRIGMYLGSSDVRGLHQLVWEAVDNSIDEAMAGYCNKIVIELKKNNIISVIDNGRGIPVEEVPKYKKSALELVMTKLHAGGKFDNNVYKVSGGTHGVGISAVNAVSEWLEATSRRDGKKYRQRYEKGKPVTEVEYLGKTDKHGTTVTFKPDATIFDTVNFDINTIKTRLRELSFLNKGVKIVVRNEYTNKKTVYKAKSGLCGYVGHLNTNKNSVHDDVIYFTKKKEHTSVEVGMQYTDSSSENVLTFANNINTHEGGTHLAGFRGALTKVLNAYALNKKLLKRSKDGLTGDDYREGLTAVISVKLENPQFEGQTKTKLGNGDIKGIVETLVREGLSEWLEENPKSAKSIVQRAMLSAEVREAARKARELVEVKNKKEVGTLPGKLSDCSEKNPMLREIFIVEGESAGGSSRQGRDRHYQAILPLKGKILNVEKAKLTNIIKNEEIQSLIKAIGISVSKNGDYDISNARYHKIIILTDADTDGCLRGKTKIKLLDGTIKSMKELSKLYPNENTKFWVYAKNKNGKIVPAMAHSVRITKHVDKIYKVILDNDSVIYATGNHPFRLSDGNYKRTDGLKIDDSLSAMYYRYGETYNKGREYIYQKGTNYDSRKRDWIPTHKLVAFKMYGKKLYTPVHHKNNNQTDNRPENLEYRKDHRSLHSKNSYLVTNYNGSLKQRKHLQKLHYTTDTYDGVHKNFIDYNYSEKHSKVVSKRNRRMWKDDNYREYMSAKISKWGRKHGKILSRNCKKQWSDPEISFRMRATRMVNVIKSTIQKYGKLNEKNYNLTKHKGIESYKTMLTKLNLRNAKEATEYAENYNHKVVSVELIKLKKSIPVYDMTVEKYHNFAVDLGDNSCIFVHNSHIRTLLLTLFYRYMRKLIDLGYIYIGKPPLYKIKKGRKEYYEYSDEGLNTILNKIGREGVTIQRYKGLGEMNPEQLWATTMNPATRTLVQVNLNDSKEAEIEKTFELLMGDDVESRRDFIETYAKEVKT